MLIWNSVKNLKIIKYAQFRLNKKVINEGGQ